MALNRRISIPVPLTLDTHHNHNVVMKRGHGNAITEASQIINIFFFFIILRTKPKSTILAGKVAVHFEQNVISLFRLFSLIRLLTYDEKSEAHRDTR